MPEGDPPVPIPLPMLDHDAPEVPLRHLDQLWFQVGGTRCNFSCRHCFISCNPHNHEFAFLTLQEVRSRLIEAEPLGVMEYYFTGGEPFLNPEMTAILELALEHGPASVLTNASVLRDDWLLRLRHAEAQSLYSLEWRVALDGCDPESNDPIRGEGTFERTLSGIRKLVAYGFLPIVTAANMGMKSDDELFHGFVQMLRANGYERPRVKILPALRIGAEVDRDRGYDSNELVSRDMLEGFDVGNLLCSHARIVTDRGIHVCPILIEAPDSILGLNLAGASRSFALRHRACYTCWQYGSICSNPAVGGHDA